MPDTLLASLVVAATTLIGTLAYLIVERRKMRHETGKQNQLLTDAVRAATANLVYPYAVDAVRTYTTILDADGSAELECTFVGFRAVRGTAVRSFDGDLESTGSISDGPHLIFRSRPDMELLTESPQANRVAYSVKFASELTSTDPPCSFTIRHRTTSALYVHADKIRERYKGDVMQFEFASETVQTPMERLEISVDFGPFTGIHCFPNVTFGERNIPAVEERQRVEASFVWDGRTVRWTIDMPQPGLRYLTCWYGI